MYNGKPLEGLKQIIQFTFSFLIYETAPWGIDYKRVKEKQCRPDGGALNSDY